MFEFDSLVFSLQAMSIATKVAIQMNVKLGGEAWAVSIPPNRGPECKVTLVGLLSRSNEVRCQLSSYFLRPFLSIFPYFGVYFSVVGNGNRHVSRSSSSRAFRRRSGGFHEQISHKVMIIFEKTGHKITRSFALWKA